MAFKINTSVAGSPMLAQLAHALYGYAGGNDAFTDEALNKAQLQRFGVGDGDARAIPANMQNSANEWLTNQKALAGVGAGKDPVNLSSLAGLTGAAIKAHPYASMGLGALGAMNLGGLTDNDKYGGQLGGAALGGLGAATLAQGNPALQAALVMGGGGLGSLFDKLRAKKEQEQHYGGR